MPIKNAETWFDDYFVEHYFTLKQRRDFNDAIRVLATDYEPEEIVDLIKVAKEIYLTHLTQQTEPGSTGVRLNKLNAEHWNTI